MSTGSKYHRSMSADRSKSAGMSFLDKALLGPKGKEEMHVGFQAVWKSFLEELGEPVPGFARLLRLALLLLDYLTLTVWIDQFVHMVWKEASQDPRKVAAYRDFYHILRTGVIVAALC